MSEVANLRDHTHMPVSPSGRLPGAERGGGELRLPDVVQPPVTMPLSTSEHAAPSSATLIGVTSILVSLKNQRPSGRCSSRALIGPATSTITARTCGLALTVASMCGTSQATPAPRVCWSSSSSKCQSPSAAGRRTPPRRRPGPGRTRCRARTGRRDRVSSSAVFHDGAGRRRGPARRPRCREPHASTPRRRQVLPHPQHRLQRRAMRERRVGLAHCSRSSGSASGSAPSRRTDHVSDLPDSAFVRLSVNASPGSVGRGGVPM
jgi:hypothetical protein